MKTIKISLCAADIDRALKELSDYKKSLAEKTEIFRKRVAEELKDYAKQLFDAAEEDIISGGNDGLEPVDVKVEEREGGLSVVLASGPDAVFIEFGAGVYHNGAAGSSPHPKGREFGYTIGGYGKGFGKRKAWGYRDKSGQLIVTRGTEAMMPMLNAADRCAEIAARIAREVFAE